METLSHILASFDIFQIIIGAFPHIFIPIFHAFQSMFVMLSDVAGKQFASHPGLISGTILFLLVYLTGTGLSKLKQTIISARSTSAKLKNCS